MSRLGFLVTNETAYQVLTIGDGHSRNHSDSDSQDPFNMIITQQYIVSYLGPINTMIFRKTIVTGKIR